MVLIKKILRVNAGTLFSNKLTIDWFHEMLMVSFHQKHYWYNLIWVVGGGIPTIVVTPSI